MTSAEKTLRTCIINAWVEGEPCTQAALALASTAAGEALSQRQVGIYFTKWSQAGLCDTQTTANGRPGAAYVFNWSLLNLDVATLRDAVASVLVGPDGQPAMTEHARKVRTGLRCALGVKEIGADDALLAACSEVSAHELHALPHRVHARVLEKSGKRNAENCRSAVRRMLREAAERGSIPVILEKNWIEDDWSEARDHFFGAACGALTQKMRAFRTYWHHYSTGAKHLFPDLEGPHAVTPDMVNRICAWHWEQGRTYLRSQIQSMLKWIARAHASGPFATYVHAPETSWTHNGWRNPGRLLAANGRAGTGDWAAMVDMVAQAGYSDEWRTFLEWYGEFLTLEFDAIETQPDRFPTRPPRWHLSAGTLVKRIINIRAILHLAPIALRMPAEQITPSFLLGEAHRPFLSHVKTWWAGRARDEMDCVSSPNSDGLEKLVLAYGLMAYALHLRLRHERGSAPRVAEDHRLLIQQGTDMEIAEKKLFEAYRAANSHAKTIKAQRRRESNALGDNTVRDLPRLIRNTPAEFWIAILDEMLRQVQAQVDFSPDGAVRGIRAENPHKFFKLVADAYYHGWLVSTGMRISETAHIRLDIQYSTEWREAALREAHLRSIDRKETANTLPHETAIRDRYVPRWLESLFLEQARPFFMVVWPGEKGRAVQKHEWLFVDAKGRPYGCTEEAADGEGRDAMAFNSRLQRLRRRWQARAARTAASIGRKLPALPREHANHAVRIAMGYQIRQELGLTAAANYLGDKEGSVENVYAGVSGRLVDVSVLADDYTDWQPPSRQPARAGSRPAKGKPAIAVEDSPRLAALRKQLDDLTTQFADGEIDFEQYDGPSSRLEAAIAACAG
ncbi:MAG: hypothetical protein ACYC28_05645 [Longimicrobiales bacterium]